MTVVHIILIVNVYLGVYKINIVVMFTNHFKSVYLSQNIIIRIDENHRILLQMVPYILLLCHLI